MRLFASCAVFEMEKKRIHYEGDLMRKRVSIAADGAADGEGTSKEVVTMTITK